MLVDVLGGFVQELRATGIPVSMVETIDAMEALRHTDLADREAFKASLGATLVKNARHYDAFETAFDVFFALQRPAPGEPEPDLEPLSADDQINAGGGGGDGNLDSLLEALQQALAEHNLPMLRSLAQQAVRRLAGMEAGRPVGGTYYLYRTLRQLDTEGLLERLVEDAKAGGALSALEEQLIREDFAAQITELRDEIEQEIRRRLVADRGREAVAKTLRKPLIEETDLMHATRADLIALDEVIQPLTRKMATRLARRRRKRDGRLDFKKTMRRSLAMGGVPLEPQFKAAHPSKPEIFLLCDISGSMATFARFTLQFTFAMSSQFSKLRSFAFIDALDEVTSFFEPGVDFSLALNRVTTEAEVVWLDGHSDYGRSFEQFWSRYAGFLTPRSVVIVTGDARSNYRDPQAEILAAIASEARAVYWLNPEPKAYWDTGDSVMSKYRSACTDVREVRNLRQLEEFIESVAVPSIGMRPSLS